MYLTNIFSTSVYKIFNLQLKKIPFIIIERVLCPVAMVNIPVNNENAKSCVMLNFTVINTNYRGMLISYLPFEAEFVYGILCCYGNIVEMTKSHTEFTLGVMARGSDGERERERERVFRGSLHTSQISHFLLYPSLWLIVSGLNSHFCHCSPLQTSFKISTGQ